MNRLGFRARLTLLHLAAIVVLMALGAAVARWSVSRAVHEQLDAALLALAETESAMLASAPGQPVHVHEVAPGAAQPSFLRLDRLVQIVDRDGNVLARSANLGSAQLPVPAALLARLRDGETVFDTLPEFGGEPTRMVALPVAAGDTWIAVQVAGSLDDVNQVVAATSLLFIALAFALLGTIGGIGALLTRRVFRVIDQIVHQVRGIGEDRLGERVETPVARDEIGALVDTLNDMLQRLQLSFEAQRHFTADASHELRSPLSRLRAELELALRRPRSAEDYVATLGSCLEEVDRLTRLAEELLLLARLEARQEESLRESIDVVAVAATLCERFAPLAATRQVTLRLNAPRPVDARIGRGHLERVLGNLLDNALKFTGSGTPVTLRIASVDDQAVIEVADCGPGLDPAELPHLFDRFFRGAAARRQETPGTGLGLALSRAIALAYGGRIAAANRPQGGAVFTLHLPAVDRVAVGPTSV